MEASHFTDDRDYVVTEVRDLGERQRTISFVWRDGRRSAVTVDVAYDSDEMRDRLIRAWATTNRTFGSDRKAS
jgi:hypothetical protein